MTSVRKCRPIKIRKIGVVRLSEELYVTITSVVTKYGHKHDIYTERVNIELATSFNRGSGGRFKPPCGTQGQSLDFILLCMCLYFFEPWFARAPSRHIFIAQNLTLFHSMKMKNSSLGSFLLYY